MIAYAIGVPGKTAAEKVETPLSIFWPEASVVSTR